MRPFLLAIICSAALSNATRITLHGTLLCTNPYSLAATVFLMEQDFGSTFLDEIDEDDVLAYKEVTINEPFELEGEEFELDGLELYVYMRYNCDKGYKEEVINLGDTQFMNRVFYLRKDLETGKTVVR